MVGNKVKRILSRPIFLLCVIILLGIVIYITIPSIKSDIVFILEMVLSLMIVISFHELGHICFGCYAGFHFHFFAVGPVLIIKEQKKVSLKENKNLAFFGGASYMFPPKKSNEIKNRYILYLLGGPLFSMFGAMGSYLLWLNNSLDYFLWLSTLHLAIFIVTAIPATRKNKNDGGLIFLLLRNDFVSNQMIVCFLVSAEMCGIKRPREWNTDLVRQSLAFWENPTEDTCSVNMFLFYYFSDKGGIEMGIKYIQPILYATDIKKNKLVSSFFYSVFMMYKLFKDENDISEYKELSHYISPFDRIAYKRAQIIMQYLNNDKKNLLINLKEFESLLLKSRNNYGYFDLEIDWLVLLKNIVKQKNESNY